MVDGVAPEGVGIKLPIAVTEVSKNETASAWSSLMDTMEASRENQGDYFLKIGTKTPDADLRALILREPFNDKIPTPMGSVNQPIFVVMTADGPKGIKSGVFGGMGALLKNPIIKGIQIDPAFGGFVKAIPGNRRTIDELVIFNQASGGSVDSKEFVFDRDLTDADMPMIDKAIVDSIAKVQSPPHKTEVKESPEEIKMAQALSARISQLSSKP